MEKAIQVLIVDDNEANLRLLEIIFGRQSHQTVRARNGQEALQRAREEKPDLVISDILMPVMDGFSLCREWMKDAALRTVPFVFYSSTYHADEDEALALALGAVRFLRKPMEPVSFLLEIDRVFEAAKAGKLPPPGPPLQDEAQYLRLYNSRLVEKLEKRQQELERSEAHYRLLFESIKDGIALSGAQTGILEEVNEALCTLVGRSREDLQNHPLTLLHPPEEAGLYRQIFEDFAAGKLGPAGLDLEVQAASGARIPVDITISSLAIQGRHFLLSIFRDITAQKNAEAERRTLEEQLLRHKTLETLGMLANGVAHEVRNPLNSIRVVAAALEKKLGAASEYKEHMDYINEHVDRLSRLMSDLLLVGRPQDPVDFASCDLLLIVREAASNIEAADPSAQGRFSMKASAESFGVRGIRSKLVQVFVNLLSNALSFSPKGAQVEVRLFVERGKATVTVSDRGSGIPPKLLPRLFEPFQSQRKGGTGLGLTIVQKTVEGHGGTVTGENRTDGLGAVFTVRLPLA